MRVRFWGTRGSIPCPGPETVRYGGNTSCVEVRADDGTLLVLDCGTGARKLGLSMARSEPSQAHLLITHTHADHIHGFPFFAPAFMAGWHLTVYGPAGVDRPFPRAVGGLMDYAYFPVPVKELPADVEFVELGEGDFGTGSVQVRARYLNHTAPCLGYRIEVGGATLVYATDHEPHTWPARPPGVEGLVHRGDESHLEFLSGADLLIHDAQYTADEYRAKVGWGHSPMEYVADLAAMAGVRRLALFHHDPIRDDEALEAVLGQARDRVGADGPEVLAAAEGLVLVLPERQPEPGQSSAEPPALRMVSRPRILLVEDEDDIAFVVESALEDDGYELRRSADGPDALRLLDQERFDLVLLDVMMPGMDGFSVCRTMRQDERLRELPVIMITARSDADDILQGFGDGATDYVAKPLILSQLRARIRSWLDRAAANR